METEKPKFHVKQRYSKNGKLREDANIQKHRSTRYNDLQPHWILELCEELGIDIPAQAEPPHVKMQRDLQRMADNIEAACRRHRTGGYQPPTKPAQPAAKPIQTAATGPFYGTNSNGQRKRKKFDHTKRMDGTPKRTQATTRAV